MLRFIPAPPVFGVRTAHLERTCLNENKSVFYICFILLASCFAFAVRLLPRTGGFAIRLFFRISGFTITVCLLPGFSRFTFASSLLLRTGVFTGRLFLRLGVLLAAFPGLFLPGTPVCISKGARIISGRSKKFDQDADDNRRHYDNKRQERIPFGGSFPCHISADMK